MSNPERTDIPSEPKKQDGLLKRLLKMILNNWAWKLTCLVVAVILWAGLIMQDSSLVRSKVFSDVTINVLNEEALMRNGYIVVSGLGAENLSGLRMRVDVPQRVYETVQASNFNVRVDLNRIHGAGRQTLQVLTTNSTTYGTVTDLSIAYIDVEVEEYVTRSRIPVRIATTGQLREGLYATAAAADPIYVAIAGPKSKVDAVARCVVPYDLTEMDYIGTERTALPFRLESRDEEVIPQDQITTSPLNSGVKIETITVEQTFYELVSLPVDIGSLISGQPAEGYHVESISVVPSQVKVAFGEQTDTAAVENLRVVQPIDISGLQTSKSFSASLVRPADAKYMGLTGVQVTVEIEADRNETEGTDKESGEV